MFSLIQHIVVTLLSRSKTVVEFFPIAAICRILPNKSNPEHVLYPLPWQIKSTLIILVFLPVRARSNNEPCTDRTANARRELAHVRAFDGLDVYGERRDSERPKAANLSAWLIIKTRQIAPLTEGKPV